MYICAYDYMGADNTLFHPPQTEHEKYLTKTFKYKN